MKKNVADGLLGVCVADALGVPVEFNSRLSLKKNPVVDVRGFGTYNQPPGTWSDDSSLTLCLAESLCTGFDLADMAQKFCAWLFEKHWTPHNNVFDVGHATREAIFALKSGKNPIEAGGKHEHSNGNGSLMRILPLAYYLLGKEDIFNMIHQVSCLTHAHPRSQIGCAIYIVFAIELIKEKKPKDAYRETQKIIKNYYTNNAIYAEELNHYKRILEADISSLEEEDIDSKGYVVFTLEAALWCFLTSHSYSETTLKAINLGEDTDTTAAVAGGLAGIYYGKDNIPKEWLDILVRKDDIINLAQKLQSVCP